MSRRVSRLLLVLAGLAVLLLLGRVALFHFLTPEVTLSAKERSQLLDVFGGEHLPPPPDYSGLQRTSYYVPMRDGVRLAVDVLLPEDLPQDTALPAVFMPTRYWRSWDLRFGLGQVLGADRFQRMLVAHGYAVVLVDARGSGASFGSRNYPWSPDERQDYVELMDWALAQPWCDGNLAASGISYGGTAAEFMAIAAHPALKAVLPQFSLYDTYADIAFPGGVFNQWFVSNWSRFNQTLDAGKVPSGIGVIGSLLVRGPAPVPKPEHAENKDEWGYKALERAIRDHAANVDIHKAALQAQYRDDVSSLAGVSVDAFSPHSYVQQANAGDAAWYSWGGWHDGAYAGSLLKRVTTLTSPQRAVIGPWNHGGVQDTSPFHETDARPHPPLSVQYLEQIRFLDHYLKGQGPPPIQEIRYYTLGEGRWKTSSNWPPEGFEPMRLYLADKATLANEPPQAENSRDLRVNYDLGSGEKNRWRTQILRSDVIMPPRPIREQGVLSWTSQPLSRDVECTGSPLVALHLSSDQPEAAVFAYLEDVSPEGSVRYVSEAPFACVNRKISQETPPYTQPGPYHSFKRKDAEDLPAGEIVSVRFDLLPVSYLFRKGHRIRLVITAHDKDQFAPALKREAARLRIHSGNAQPSHLELPAR